MSEQEITAEELDTVHLIGVGGVGMSGLARLLLTRGIPTSGSELREWPALAGLRADLKALDASTDPVLIAVGDAARRHPIPLGAFDELIRAGKVRIVGCSNETSWGLMKSIQVAERLGVARSTAHRL